jgi:ribonuclease R
MTPKQNKKPEAAQLIRSSVLQVFNDHPHRPLNYKQVMKKLMQEPLWEIMEPVFNTLDDKTIQQLVVTTIESLAATEELEEVERGKYRPFPTENFIVGKIDITAGGNAYVMNENFEDDIVIPRGSTLNAFNGDTVKVSLYARRKGGRAEGEVVEVVERARTDFAGILQISDRFAFLVTDARNGADIFIPLHKLNGARNGQKAVARLTEWPPEAKNPTGEIVKILGMPGENDAEMDAILVEYGFPLSFPAEVEKEAEEVPYRIPRKEISKRRDFRKITTFTIDPVDAKDFDDALSVQWLENGNIEVGVHIADVSYYVTPDSYLDAEGYSRATSIYLVDRVIPMLPEKLSNLVCSLRPGEDKLCYSAVFEIDKDANILSEWFGRTIIHSQKRFTYEEAQEVIETGEGELKKEILELDRLAKIMRKARFVKGAISFEKVEVRFRLDHRGHPVDVYLKENKDSNKLIEEFMLLANKKVASRIGEQMAKEKGKEYPFVYRVHDVPNTDKLESFSLFAGRFGYRLNTRNDKEIAHSLNKLMVDVRGKAEQNVLEQLAIRTMAKAIYTTDNIGHYGLSFDFYTHFTSPIRRYPDIMVHRLLDHYLAGGKPANAEQIEEACKHSTDMEIRSSEAERASVKFKQVQYLNDRKGEVFDGLISGVTEWGLFIELTDNKCEGLIRIRDLGDDFYELDEKNYCLVGHRTKKKYQLGDKLQVMLKSADLVKKQIDFILYDEFNTSIGGRESLGGFGNRNSGFRERGRESRSSSKASSKKKTTHAKKGGSSKKSKGGRRR